MSSTEPLATIQREQGSLAGHRHFYMYEGMPFNKFTKESAYAAMKTKPYFYMIQVDSCEPHATIKIGISDNKKPLGRLWEYAYHFNFSFKVIMILTFYPWKKDIPEGVQKGTRPLQERFEKKVKDVMKDNKLNARGKEWVDPANKDKILAIIKKIRGDPTFTSRVPTTTIPLHHPPAVKYSGVDEGSVVAATGKLPTAPEHQDRIKKISGKTVDKALQTRVKDNKGIMTTYSKEFLKYDLKQGYVQIV